MDNTAKFKLIMKLILITILLIPFNINADADYSNIENRARKNTSMMNIANEMESKDTERFKDKYLKDLAETNYKTITKEKQQIIQNLADYKILNGENELTDFEKITKFYNWIKTNFYYYENSSEIKNLGINCNNPYYLIANEYNVNGKVRAREKGYAAMLVALARTQDIPARIIEGYYNREIKNGQNYWVTSVKENEINHYWTQIYINGKWIIADPFADSNNIYNEEEKTYISKSTNTKNIYLNPTIEEVSKTHIMFKERIGSKELKYTTDEYEQTKIKTFLDKKYQGVTNGKRINSLYNTTNPTTWYSKNDTLSMGDGTGKIKRIYWPLGKGISGSLNLSKFSSLEILRVKQNKISSLYLNDCPALTTVSVWNNKMKTIEVTGSKNLKLLSAQTNGSTYVKYNFGVTSRTAIIKATSGGSVSVRYEKFSRTKHQHKLTAVPETGYEFKGWYKGNKKISSKKTLVTYNMQSFTYTAKFEKRTTYILISIKNQKLWYYQNNKLLLTSKIVTGQKNEYDTPKGIYQIRGKDKEVYLIGEDYKSWVDYWMLIDSKTQIGLHDAQWRSTFGGTIYKYNGSHGCINLPYNVAKKIYNTAPVGTKVIIN